MCIKDRNFKKFITYKGLSGEIKAVRYIHSVKLYDSGITSNFEITPVEVYRSKNRQSIDIDMSIRGHTSSTLTDRLGKIDSVVHALKECYSVSTFIPFEGSWNEGGCVISEGEYITINDCYSHATLDRNEELIEDLIKCLEILKEDLAYISDKSKINWNHC